MEHSDIRVLPFRISLPLDRYDAGDPRDGPERE
jgi:hypothetical protein